MILTYYTKPNFGDAINKEIFSHLLPGFFDLDEKHIFLGIGSILGLYFGTENTEKILVFSSGFAYGEMPLIDNKYDIRCVRGPLTAQALNVSPDLAITDGAVLLTLLPEYQKPVKKKYRFSFIPHHHSERMFNQWNEVLPELGIHHINPKSRASEVITQIRQSECILAEAMHGAIIADCFRIPWIPVKMFQHINAFKWKDWAMSMNMDYQPEKLTSLFNGPWIRHILNHKFYFDKTNILTNSFAPLYKAYQNAHKRKKFSLEMKEIINKEPFLSKEDHLESKISQLLEVLDGIKRDFSQGAMANSLQKK